MTLKDSYNYAGRSYSVHDAEHKASGGLVYASDMTLPGMLYMELVCSERAHAEVTAIDARAALRLRGVADVLTPWNTTRKRFNQCRKTPLQKGVPEDQELFTSRARYAGDVIAAVVAESKAAAEEGARRLRVSYRELPVSASLEASAAEDSFQIHEGGNKICETDYFCGTGEEKGTLAGSVRTTLETQQMNHVAMETHSYLADWFNGELTIWSPTQGVYGVRTVVADLFGLPYSKVRVIKVPMGGSFGGKQEFMYEPHAACAAMRLGRPVKLHLSRTQSLISTTVRPALKTTIETSFTRDGDFISCSVESFVNSGAYAGIAINFVNTIKTKPTKSYKFPSYRFKGAAYYTNSPVIGGMRGWGAPEMLTPFEIHINEAARRLGLDPVEMRLRNTYAPYEREIAHGLSLGNCRGKDCLTIGAREFRWDERRKRVKDTGRFRRGVGVAYVGYQNGFYPRPSNLSVMTIKMNEDGSVCLQTSVHEVGCGTLRSMQIIAGEVLSIDPDNVYVTEGDTKYTQFDLGTYGSRTTFIAGECARRAAEALKKVLLDEAAKLLSLTPDELELCGGFVVSRTRLDTNLSYGEVASRALVENGTALFASASWKGVSNPGSFAANFAEVEVDTLTGFVKVTDFLSVNDIGFALNRQMCENQVKGGVQMAAGYALCEDIAVGSDGRPKNDRLSRYHTLNSADMPRVRVIFVEEGGDEGPFGAKTIGEVSTVAGAAAIASAVSDALGAEITRLPLTPERIAEIMTKAEAAR